MGSENSNRSLFTNPENHLKTGIKMEKITLKNPEFYLEISIDTLAHLHHMGAPK